MKTLFVLVGLTLSTSVMAQTCSWIGQQYVCSGGGYSSTTQMLGNQSYTREQIPNGYGGYDTRHTTCTTVGGFQYCN